MGTNAMLRALKPTVGDCSPLPRLELLWTRGGWISFARVFYARDRTNDFRRVSLSTKRLAGKRAGREMIYDRRR